MPEEHLATVEKVGDREIRPTRVAVRSARPSDQHERGAAAGSRTSLHTPRVDLPGRFNEIDVLRRYERRVEAMLRGAPVPPYEVLIHPSSSCNLRCAWCVGDHVPAPSADGLQVLSASKTADGRLPDVLGLPTNMLSLLRSIREYTAAYDALLPDGTSHTVEEGVEAVSFSGLIGEPLNASEAVLAGLDYMADSELRVGLFTNGTRMGPAVQDRILRIAYVHVSIDAATGETYSRLKFEGRPQGTHLFESALRNVTQLIDRRATGGRSHLEINASFVLYPDNYREVLAAGRLLRDMGVDCFRVKRDNTSTVTLGPSEQAEADDLIRTLEEESEGTGFRVLRIHDVRAKPEARMFTSCMITNLMAAVGSDGHLYPCNYHPRPGGASYGSAVDQPFGSVWEGSRRRSLMPLLPTICPMSCDPFKGRANSMLSDLADTYRSDGLDALRANVISLTGLLNEPNREDAAARLL